MTQIFEYHYLIVILFKNIHDYDFLNCNIKLITI